MPAEDRQYTFPTTIHRLAIPPAVALAHIAGPSRRHHTKILSGYRAGEADRAYIAPV